MSATFLSLAENLALMAGAGAGKTHGLISLALHALAGARSANPLPPGRLCALTFTEKAAAEMKDRLRSRVAALAVSPDGEKELLQSLAQYGKPAPSSSFWNKVQTSLDSAFIGTFHSFCAQLLKRFAVEARLDPRFGLLEESQATSIFDRCAQTQVIADLESQELRRDEVRRLIRAFGFQGRGDRGARLLDLLAKIHLKLAEDGRAGESLPEPHPQEQFAAIAQSLCAAIRETLDLPSNPGTECPKLTASRVLPFLSSCAPEQADQALDLSENLVDSIRLNAKGVNRQTKPVLKALQEEARKFTLVCGDMLAAPLHRDFLRLLRRVESAFQAEKEKSSVLDFSDLVRRARDLLRDSPAVRIEAQARIGVLLVDEFQDTNRLQLDLVALLCERRSGAARPVKEDAYQELPLEPAMLACVGDRKQSIYEFRGADVSVFTDLAQRLAQGEGRVEYLRQNRRSRPALIDFFNGLFTEVMRPAGAAAESWKVAYQPEHDNLVAVRPAGPTGPCVELIRVAGDDSQARRLAEAQAVAAHIAALIDPQGPPVVGKDRTGPELRRAQGKDIAILLRRFTHLELFRRQLLARSIAHLVARGGGFYHAQEVLDLRNFLALAGDPHQRLALCALLRSPMVALKDATLARLAINQRLSLAALRLDISDLAPADEVERVADFLAAYDRFAADASGLGVATALERVVECLDWEAVLAAGFEGEQKIANTRKLIDWLRDNRPLGPWAAANRLHELASSESREGPALLADESDPNAVRIMTVHQAKGLEFPVVYVPDCGAVANADRDAVLFDRQLGLALRPRGKDGRALTTTTSQDISRALQSRQEAEAERLFYVAATRARDLLVFSGEQWRGESWRRHLDSFLSTDSSSLMRVVEAQSMPLASQSLAPMISPAHALSPISASASGSPSGSGSESSLRSPTESGSASGSGSLSESESSLRSESESSSGSPFVSPLASPLPVLEQRPAPSINSLEITLDQMASLIFSRTLERPSTVAHAAAGHRLLKRIDFQAPIAPQIAAFLAGERIDPQSAPGLALRQAAQSLAAAPVGQSLTQVPPSRLWRGFPFAIDLRQPDFTLRLRGEIDLLAVLDNGAALILKYLDADSEQIHLEWYNSQLACSVWAMRSFLPASVPLRAGLVSWCDNEAVPRIWEYGKEEIDKTRAMMIDIGRQLRQMV